MACALCDCPSGKLTEETCGICGHDKVVHFDSSTAGPAGQPLPPSAGAPASGMVSKVLIVLILLGALYFVYTKFIADKGEVRNTGQPAAQPSGRETSQPTPARSDAPGPTRIGPYDANK